MICEKIFYKIKNIQIFTYTINRWLKMNTTPTIFSLNINLTDNQIRKMNRVISNHTASAVPRIPPANGHVPNRPKTELR
jgi:hypothetical protein